MHHLQIVQNAIKELEKAKARKARVILGMMVCSKAEFSDLFRELSRGTPLENIQLEIVDIPVEIRCGLCGYNGRPGIVDSHARFVRCPSCGKVATVLRGNEFNVQAIG